MEEESSVIEEFEEFTSHYFNQFTIIHLFLNVKVAIIHLKLALPYCYNAILNYYHD